MIQFNRSEENILETKGNTKTSFKYRTLGFTKEDVDISFEVDGATFEKKCVS